MPGNPTLQPDAGLQRIMQAKPEKSLRNLLDQGPSILGNIISRVQILTKIDEQLQACMQQLDPLLARGCCAANLREGCLVIQVDNAAIATKLRYLSSALLSELRAGGLHSLGSVRVMVRGSD